MDVNCKGRRAVVTAGGSGIGRVIAETLADNGAQVFVCDVAEDFLEAFAAARPDIGAIAADVSSAADVARLFDAALAARLATSAGLGEAAWGTGVFGKFGGKSVSGKVETSGGAK